MPELPDVAAFRKYFDKHALKKQVSLVRVRNPKIIRENSPEELEEGLAGHEFVSTTQYGKYLFARLDGSKWFVMHFGMTGYLERFEKENEEPAYTRLLIGFKDGSFLAYVNRRMLGWIGLIPDPDELIKRKGLGPSALDPGFDFEAFKSRLSGRKGEIKPVLMNQGIAAGIGNVYSDEILLQAGVDPRTGVMSLREEQLRAIFDSMKEVLATAVSLEAETVRFPDNYLLRDRRKGAKCPLCGGKLDTARIGGRTAFFCGHCQAFSGGRTGTRIRNKKSAQ
ncbi:MAG: DNA-formamidopyrimidine glycosylase family protein [Syntrophobacteraceae bacterium]